MASLLLLAQGFGWVHAVQHAHKAGHLEAGFQATQVLQPAQAATAHQAPQAHPAGHHDDVFGHAASDPSCRLVDQLGHADAPFNAALQVRAAPAGAEVLALVQLAPLALARLGPYQARAPPSA